jgi:tripartite-type tricarboxylate transporter receptor subunit TctC
MVNSSLAVNPSLRRTMPYRTPQDIAGVTQIANLQLALVARPDAPFNTLAELIAYAKKNPGKLTYGTPGAGSTTHLGTELLKRETGIDMLHSPFKGSAPAHTELMGGRIDVVADPFLSVIPYVKAGRMKMIATLGERKVPGYDYPTIAETLPGFSVNALLGLVAPAATPKPILQKIQADTARVLNTPETKKRIEDFGMEVVASRPEQFDAFIAAEMKRWARVIKEAKIEPE